MRDRNREAISLSFSRYIYLGTYKGLLVWVWDVEWLRMLLLLLFRRI